MTDDEIIQKIMFHREEEGKLLAKLPYKICKHGHNKHGGKQCKICMALRRRTDHYKQVSNEYNKNYRLSEKGIANRSSEKAKEANRKRQSIWSKTEKGRKNKNNCRSQIAMMLGIKTHELTDDLYELKLAILNLKREMEKTT